MTTESTVQATIRLALGAHPDRVVLWRNNVGSAQHTKLGPDGSVTETRVAYGVGGTGGADLVGILRPSGRFFALEVKTPTGRVRPEQVQFGALVRACGGYFAVVRSADDALRALDEAERTP